MGIQSASFTAIVLLASSPVFGEHLAPDAKRRAVELWATVANNETNGAPTMRKVRNLTEEERALVLTHYREEFDKESRREPFMADQYLMRLAMLGDSEARDRIVASWVRGRGAAGGPKFWDRPDDLILLESPEVIAQIGDLLFMNEPYRESYDVGYYPPQELAFLIVAETLQRAPAFSHAVREWARQIYQIRNGSGWAPKGALEMVRAWYRANEALLKRGDFTAVQPGPSPPSEQPLEPAVAPLSATPSPSRNLAATPMTRSASEPDPTASPWNFIAIAAICLALLASLHFFWKRRA